MGKAKKKRSQGKSFRNQIHVVLALLGIMPYLLTVYIFMEQGMNVTESILLMAAIALTFHLAGFQILRQFSDTLLKLANATNLTKTGGVYVEIPHDHTTTELSDITRNFNMLLNELEESKKQYNDITIQLMKRAREDMQNYQKRLAESDQRHESLKPYVSSSVLEQIMEQGSTATLRNENRMVTVLFADVRSFTSLSERMEPADVIDMLNEYFETMVQIIHEHHGVLDKFVGDQIMAVFGLSAPRDRTTIDAVNAALEMRVATAELMEKRRLEGRPTFSAGIGLNSGEVIAGNLGSASRKDYTVIGDTVNVAARLEHLAKGDEILLSEETYQRCRADIEVKLKGTLKVKGRDNAVKCFELVGRKQD